MTYFVRTYHIVSGKKRTLASPSESSSTASAASAAAASAADPSALYTQYRSPGDSIKVGGRKRVKNLVNIGEGSTRPKVEKTCSVCGQIGHNANGACQLQFRLGSRLRKPDDFTESNIGRLYGGEGFSAALDQVLIDFNSS